MSQEVWRSVALVLAGVVIGYTGFVTLLFMALAGIIGYFIGVKGDWRLWRHFNVNVERKPNVKSKTRSVG